MVLKSTCSQLIGTRALEEGQLFEIEDQKRIESLLKKKKAVEATDSEIKKYEAAKAKAAKAE